MDGPLTSRHHAYMGEQVSTWTATILGLVTAFAFYWVGRGTEKIVAARAAHKRAKASVPVLRRLFWAAVRAAIATIAVSAGLVFLMGLFAVNSGEASPQPSPSPSPSRPR